QKKHTIEIVVDRIVARPDARGRLTDSVETARELAQGLVGVAAEAVDGPKRELLFSEALACIDCGLSVPEIAPRMFSFNSPYGACAACGGLGSKEEVDEAKIVEDPTKPLTEGALGIVGSATSTFFNTMFKTLLKHYK